MINESKNYIPDDVLDEAGGDPRTAFGTMALQELAVIEQGSAKQRIVVMKENMPLNIQTQGDVWSRMDDI